MFFFLFPLPVSSSSAGQWRLVSYLRPTTSALSKTWARTLARSADQIPQHVDANAAIQMQTWCRLQQSMTTFRCSALAEAVGQAVPRRDGVKFEWTLSVRGGPTIGEVGLFRKQALLGFWQSALSSAGIASTMGCSSCEKLRCSARGIFALRSVRGDRRVTGHRDAMRRFVRRRALCFAEYMERAPEV